MPFNHAYSFAFEVLSNCEDGTDVTPSKLREPLIMRLRSLSDDQFRQACDAPWDTYECDDKDVAFKQNISASEIVREDSSAHSNSSQIEFTWWLAQDLGSPSPEHKHHLDQSALSRIFEMLADGYTEGELVAELPGGNDMPPVHYRGYWKHIAP